MWELAGAEGSLSPRPARIAPSYFLKLHQNFGYIPPPPAPSPPPSLHLADNHWMFIFKTKDKSAAAALRRQIAHRALLLSPHKACQTGWMEEKLQRASKAAASSSRQHGQLQTRCARKSRDQDSLIGASDAGLDLLARQTLIVFLM